MINRVVLVGRLTKDPIIRKLPSGVSVANFTLAIDRRYAGANQEKQTDFISCVAYRQTAEYMEQYIKKGYLVGVEGRIQTGSYDNAQGQRVYTTDVVCDSVQNYQPRATAPTQTSYEAPSRSTYAPSHEDQFSTSDFANTLDISSDDLPF